MYRRAQVTTGTDCLEIARGEPPSFDNELAAHASGMEAAQVVIRTRLARRCERQARRFAAGDHFDLDVQPLDDKVMEHARVVVAEDDGDLLAGLDGDGRVGLRRPR